MNQELKTKVESILSAMITEAEKGNRKLKFQSEYVNKETGEVVQLSQPRYRLASNVHELTDAIEILTKDLTGTGDYVTAKGYQVISGKNNSGKFNADGSEMKSYINLVKISESVDVDNAIDASTLDSLLSLMK